MVTEPVSFMMLPRALDYARRGIPVFPCQGNKRPYTPNGFHAATTDEDQIREWWGQWPRALIGMPTGQRTYIVIDLDLDPAKGLNGRDAWYDLTASHEEIDTWESLTPRGGSHLFFKPPPGVEIRNSTGQLGEGIDVRGDGGYIILPPSIGERGVYLWEASNPENVAPMPQWLIERTREPTRKKSNGSGGLVAAARPIYEAGTRNDGMAREAGHLVKAGLTGARLDGALQAANQEQCRPPLSSEEISRVAASVGRYAPGIREEEIEEREREARGAIEIIPAMEWTRHLEPPDYLVDGLIERGSYVGFVGSWGAGKTAIVTDIALRVASGLPVQNRPTTGVPVIWVVGEGQAGFRRRIVAWSRYNDVSVPEGLLIVPHPVPMNDPEHAAALEEAIGEASHRYLGGESPAVIVLDTLARNFGPGDENSNTDMMTHANAIERHLSRPFGASVWEPHHTGHSATERGRGASALPAALDVEFLIWTDAPGYSSMRANKMKDGEMEEPVHWHLEGVEVPEVGRTSVVAIEANEVPVQAQISTAGNRVLHTLRELITTSRRNLRAQGRDESECYIDRKALRGAAGYGTGATGKGAQGGRQAFSKLLDSLIEQDLIELDSRGNLTPKEPF